MRNEIISQISFPLFFVFPYRKITNTALDILKKLNTTNIKLMIDLFHLQHIKGNITNTLKDLQQYIGHVQVSFE